MRKRWYILAALAGGLAALAVWFWPESPRWIGHDGPGYGSLYAHWFTPDGRVHITIRTPPVGDLGKELASVITRRDTVSGRLLSKVTLDCPDTNMRRRFWLSPDGTTALVGEVPIGDDPDRDPDFLPGKWYLHDGLTGKRRAGPLAGVNNVGTFEVHHDFSDVFSPDSRWFTSRRADPQSGRPNYESVNVCSSETGEIVLELPNCQFALDGCTAIVMRRSEKEEDSTAPGYYQVLELPSGREVCRFVLPKRDWGFISQWTGQHLEVVKNIPDADTGGTLSRICRIEVTKDGVGEVIERPHPSIVCGGTAEMSYWIDSPGGLVYCRLVEPEPPPAWWAWTASKLGIYQGPVRGNLVTARVVDTATGETRYELPHPVIQPIDLSPDGRLLACHGPDDSVQVWDTAPSPRWPKAAALGIVVAASVLGLGRWRQRARPKSTSAA